MPKLKCGWCLPQFAAGQYDNANYHAWNHVYLEDGDDSGWYLLDLTSIDSGVDAFLLGTEDMDRYAPITRTGYCAAAGGDVFGCELPQLEAASYKGNESDTDQTVEDTATEPEEITGDVSNEEVKTEENTTDGAVNSNAGSTSTSDKTESSTRVFAETEITIESNESDSSTTKTSESTVISETGNGFSAEQGSVSTQHSEDTASQSTASSEQSANTESTLSGWDLVYQLENLAHEETEKGNYLAAISYYEQVIAIEPSEAMALYYNIGWNYHYAGYYAKGCENYIKAMKLGDTNVAWSMCYNCVMEGYSSLTQDQLYKIFSEMVQIQEQSDLYDRLSRIAYEYYGDIDSAILYMNKAIELADSGSEDEQCYLIYLYQLERKKADPNYVP